MYSTPEGSTGPSALTSYPSDHAEASPCDGFPEVSYDDPAWDDSDVWELGPAIPPDAVVLPPELSLFDAEWEGEDGC